MVRKIVVVGLIFVFLLGVGFGHLRTGIMREGLWLLMGAMWLWLMM